MIFEAVLQMLFRYNTPVNKSSFGYCYILFIIAVNCWPSENGQGGCDVNIEYELEQNVDYLELEDVVITIPIP